MEKPAGRSGDRGRSSAGTAASEDGAHALNQAEIEAILSQGTKPRSTGPTVKPATSAGENQIAPVTLNSS